jgi:sugar/nucleoside kinase (ribokinase family)
MDTRCAAIMGEALIDMIDGDCEGERVYRAQPGGSPYNVAVALARLGGCTEFIGSFGNDVLAHRLRAFLRDNGVSMRGSVTHDAPTFLSLATLEHAKPYFTYYGSPMPLGSNDLDRDLLAGAALIHCGSTVFLTEQQREAVREAFAIRGPLKTIDPNPRPTLITDMVAYRTALEAFYPLVDVVKLSADDAELLYTCSPIAAAEWIRSRGARAVIVTLGADGAFAMDDSGRTDVSGKSLARVVDTTGAGDAFMAGVIFGLLQSKGDPAQRAWKPILELATTTAALSCCAPGGAAATPTMAMLRQHGWVPDSLTAG